MSKAEEVKALAEVARAVAEALGLFGPDNDPWYGECWHSHDHHWLAKDGSDLTDPEWRCKCEDWLLQRGSLTLASKPGGPAPTGHGWLDNANEPNGDVWIEWCPLAEAPARLVAAVWRKQNER